MSFHRLSTPLSVSTTAASSGLGYEDEHLPPKVNDISVIDTYRNKSVFLTGATGFVGKVILEKILRSTPDVRRVFVLVRPRKGQPPQQRLREEVLSSPLFDTLRASRPDFDAWADSKVMAIGGELTVDNVGISDADMSKLISDLDIVIHCAAVVDFNERLDRAIQLNTLGTLRMLDIAKRADHCGAFVHVSTCYVNSNRPNGEVEEKLYPLGFDPEELIEKVSKMSSSELDTIVSTGILRNWPNTYTMTKSMTEHLVVKNRGDMPVVIVRPSIVGCSYTEPVPGWVDVISAAGAVYTAMGMGVLKFLPGSPKNIGDVIPVDYVANSILVAVPVIYKQTGKYFICHAASSSENPMCWGYPLNSVQKYFHNNPPPRAIAPAEFSFARTPQMYQLRFFLQYSIPSSLLNTISLVGSSASKKTAKLFEKLQWQVRVLTEAFKYFVENQWIFNNRNVRAIYQMLNADEQNIYDLDLSTLDWYRYSELFAYGLNKYTLKCPVLAAKQRDARYVSVSELDYSPDHDTLKDRITPDIQHVKSVIDERGSLNYPQPRPTSAVIDEVLNSEAVRAAMRNEIDALTKNAPSKKKANYVQPAEAVEQRAQRIVKAMFATQDEKVVSGMGWLFRKIWKRIYENVLVCRDNISEILEAAKTGPIVYLPTHRSYIDFLLCSYVTYFLNMPIPHIAAGEDFLGIFAVRWFFRQAGAFFIRRSFSADNLYSTILRSYVDAMLKDGQSLEFYIEGTRSRTGKMLQPKMGMLSMVTSAVQRGVVNDVTIVPMSFNYEKPMESFMYGNELLGEGKNKETLSNLVKARSVLKSNFGQATVVFGQPMSVKEWMSEHVSNMSGRGTVSKIVKEVQNERSAVVVPQALKPIVEEESVYDVVKNRAHRMYMNRTLAYEVIYEMAQGNEVMLTHIVSALMLQYRQGITRSQLIAKVEWTIKEIELRGGYVQGVELQSLERIFDRALGHLKDLVRMQNRNIYEPAISSRSEYTNMLVLGQYKNRIVHYFYREALWCVAIHTLLRNKQAITVDQALDRVRFLHVALQNEFVIKPNVDVPEDHMNTLNTMVSAGILSVNGEMIDIAATGETHFMFLCALLWPSIDSLYSAALMLYSMQPAKTATRESLVASAQSLAITQYHEGRLSFFESCSKDTLDNTFSMFHDVGVLETVPVVKKMTPDGNYVSSPQQLKLSVAYQDEKLIDSLVDRISSMRKAPIVENNRRRDLIFALPVLAKLHQSKL